MNGAKVEIVDPLTLPRNREGVGYIYVIRFSTGLVKVGSTKNPYVRFSGYRTQLTPHDIHVEWCWVSAPHVDFLWTEVSLIAMAAKAATDTRQSEYFHGVDVHDLVSEIEAWRSSLAPLPPPGPERLADGLNDYDDLRELRLYEEARDRALLKMRKSYRIRRNQRLRERAIAA